VRHLLIYAYMHIIVDSW